MPKADKPKPAPIVDFILKSKLKAYTPQTVRDYLRLYSTECEGLKSAALRQRANYILRELERLGKQTKPAKTPARVPDAARVTDQVLGGPGTEEDAYRVLDQMPLNSIVRVNDPPAWRAFRLVSRYH